MPDPLVNPIRILVVDDHQIIRDGLCALIKSHEGMMIVGAAGNRVNALQAASLHQPDVIVLDLDLGADSGLTLLPELLETARTASVIVLTGVRDTKIRDRAMQLGAKGMVLKENGATELLGAIEKVHQTGEYWLEPGAASRLFDRKLLRDGEAQSNHEVSKIAMLTQNEQALISYLGQGFDNRQIAVEMRMAESTVRNNLTRVYNKLGIKGGRLALLVYAYRHGLVKP